MSAQATTARAVWAVARNGMRAAPGEEEGGGGAEMAAEAMSKKRGRATGVVATKAKKKQKVQEYEEEVTGLDVEVMWRTGPVDRIERGRKRDQRV